MRIKISILILLVFGFFTIMEVSAQFHDPKKGGGKPDAQLSQKDNDYLDRQTKVFLDTVQSILSEYLPAIPEPRDRGMAKLLMDAVFHDHYAAFRKPVQQFFHERVNKVIKELEETKVKEGVRIWKIYDMGFIARTKTVTLAFDLVSGITSGSDDFAMNSTEIKRMARQCDALLITHRHKDHADLKIAEQFIALGLPVLSTEETWSKDPVHSKIIHPERNSKKVQQLKLKKYSLDMVVYPGHQMGSIPDNVYFITTPEGITLAHTGDQINEGDFMTDFEWIDRVAENHEVDVLMPIAWTTDIFRIVKGFNPKLVLPGHELELGHTVWDRLPYWGDDEYLGLNYAELKASKYPVVVLVWGESYQYIPDRINKK